MVNVVGAPGYEDFTADLIMEVLSVTGEPMSIVGVPETLDVFVIPSRFVKEEGC